MARDDPDRREPHGGLRLLTTAPEDAAAGARAAREGSRSGAAPRSKRVGIHCERPGRPLYGVSLTALAAVVALVACGVSRALEASGSARDAYDRDATIASELKAGHFAAAAALADAAAERDRDELHLANSERAGHLESLALNFYETGSPEGAATAERLYERALELREAAAEADPAALGGLLHELSGLAFNGGDYQKAEGYEQRALAIRERIYPPEDGRTAVSRRDLGLIYMAQGRLSEAASQLMPAMRIIESVPAEDWFDVAVGRNYLAELHRLQGDYPGAAAILEGLVAEGREKLGEENPQYPFFLNNLAGVYRDQERFDEAETLLRRSLELRRRAVPRDDASVARATFNLAELYREQGKLAEAEPLYTEALNLARRAMGADNPELYEFINQSAVLRRDQGLPRKAQPLFQEALALASRGFGPDHPRVAQSHLDLAELLRESGRCREAASHYREALRIREQVLGPDHPDVAEVLVDRARCVDDRSMTSSGPAASGPTGPGTQRPTATSKPGGLAGADSLAAARADLDRAIAILGDSEAHPAIEASAYEARAKLRRPADRAGAMDDLGRAIAVVETMRPHRGGGESVRASFFGRYTGLYDRMVGWQIADGNPEAALAAAERARGRVLLDQLDAARVDERTDPEMARRQSEARARLAELRERLAYEQSRADLPARERMQRTADLERQFAAQTRIVRELNDEAKNASAAWRTAASAALPTVAELRSTIVPSGGWMLIYEIGAVASYVFVVPEAGAVRAIPLTLEAADAARLSIAAGPLTDAVLNRMLLGVAGRAGGSGVPKSPGAPRAPGLIARLSYAHPALARGIGGLSSGADADDEALGALMRTLVPKKLWSEIRNAREVLIVPDGPLFLLPFEALVIEAGADHAATRYWLDAGPVLRYAPSATFLYQLAVRRPPAALGPAGPPAVLSVSDPDYAPAASAKGQARAQAAGGSSRGARTLVRLPGTRIETEQVQSAWKGEGEVVVLQGPDAREPDLRRALPGKRFVHVATHGLVDQEGGELFAALALTPPPPGTPPSGGDDGFLQLFEIYGLKMDCELAVLSACNSNTGRLITGEGVFALSRGFLVAGAKRVIASQWSVDDLSTAELVGNLFSRIAVIEQERSGTVPAEGSIATEVVHAGGVGASTSVAEALRDAKRRIRARREWSAPFYWAPFILTGID